MIRYRVFIITRHPIGDPERLVIVKPVNHAKKAIQYIQGLADFSGWLDGLTRIAKVGDEIYEYTEYTIE